MHIVFVHRNGPGQFVHLARHLIADGWTVTLICETLDRPVPGLRVLIYGGETSGLPPRGGVSRRQGMPYIAAGRKVAGILEKLGRHGHKPDIVMGHIAWGGMLFVKDALPDVPAIGFCEYYFQPEGGDIGFAACDSRTLQQRQVLRLRNAVQLASLEQLDAGISPTAWQKSRYPAEYQSKIVVQHEGIDTQRARPDAMASFRLTDGRLLSAGDPVVTFAARDLEPYRGFPQFMQAAARVAAEIPHARFVVAGGDGISYGDKPVEGEMWRSRLLTETGLPPDRIHFLGQIPHRELLRLFQVSAAHVYLTYPFVLSWSFLEAMACEAPIIASDTAPVQEVIRHGFNGTLADFWDAGAIADEICSALRNPASRNAMRKQARQTAVSRFDLPACVQRQQALLRQVSARFGRSSSAWNMAPESAVSGGRQT
jgi:glycosyltransferase involved in cell wall biosynthesis